MERPEVRYAQSGDLSIAYCRYGEGPVDIVVVPGFVTHLDPEFADGGRHELRGVPGDWQVLAVTSA